MACLRHLRDAIFLFYIDLHRKILFDEGGEMMFNIFEKKGQTIIQLTKGDSCSFFTEPFYDVGNDNEYNPEDYDSIVKLTEQDYVVFAIGSSSGRTYLTKILTVNDYDENGNLVVSIVPSDTRDMQSFSGYLFSFTLFLNGGESAFTYKKGRFELLDVIYTVDDLNKDLNPTEPDTEPIEPDTPDDSGDDTSTEP
jgi:hypothetical protein